MILFTDHFCMCVCVCVGVGGRGRWAYVYVCNIIIKQTNTANNFSAGGTREIVVWVDGWPRNDAYIREALQ